jgi:hypothetical protein
MSPSTLFLILCLLSNCKGNNYNIIHSANPFHERAETFDTIKAIPLPAGYERIEPDHGSFGEWLGSIKLKKDNKVYLYNGSLKNDQSVHFAVLDIPVGKKDLQQCADAVIRLRAEYLFDKKRYTEIRFSDNNNNAYEWRGDSNKIAFKNYLENVFGWCGTASLQKQLKPINLQ